MLSTSCSRAALLTTNKFVLTREILWFSLSLTVLAPLERVGLTWFHPLHCLFWCFFFWGGLAICFPESCWVYHFTIVVEVLICIVVAWLQLFITIIVLQLAEGKNVWSSINCQWKLAPQQEMKKKQTKKGVLPSLSSHDSTKIYLEQTLKSSQDCQVIVTTL